MPTEDRMALLRQMAHGVAAHFGPNCEVVIHDLTQADLEHTVVHIENGAVSGRTLGDGPSRMVLDLLRNKNLPQGDHLAYLTRTPSGKVLRSSSLYIRGPSGRPETVFSIHYDISALLAMESLLSGLTAPDADKARNPQPIPQSVSALLDELIDQSVALIGRPVALMTREDKRRAVRFLSDSGALLITKSSDKIAAHFGISKYTLYHYLGSDRP